jgi:hypothetical protein
MRQFGCIEINLTDALLLRDAIRPLARVEPYDPATVIRFCEKLYDGILKIKSNALESINVALEEQEALFINQFVGNEDWQNALHILEQTWLVLYELRNQHAYPHAPVRAAAIPVEATVALDSPPVA